MPPNRPPSTLPKLIIDMRCLQDRNYAERGIGNHARCIVAQAPAPFIGLVDPGLPPLPEPLATRATILSPHAYLPGLAPGSIFLNPSPMSPDQNFLARLLQNPKITKAACIHDFIPFDAPQTYLTHPINRLDYFAAMAWLRRYDLFLPNSEPTATRLHALYGNVPATVTGVALPAWAENSQPKPPCHILMVGGDDARKNPEILARAHAASAILRRIPLVISGTHTPATAARLRAITELQLPGRLPDSEMRALYAEAICVVIPSRAEGFSIPVIEAAAARTPAIVSDIPAHQALIPDASCRFAPDNAQSLTAILEAIVTSPPRRAAIIADQSGLHETYTATAVGARVWNALAPPRFAINRAAKPRLAFLTPMPPQKSGIADYSAALAQALRPLADVTIFSGPAISALPHASGQFDRILSAIGNSPMHTEILDLAVKWGSAVLCHDSRLLGLATARGLDHAAALASRELNRAVAPAEIEAWAEDENRREASFFADLAAAARPLIFHSPQPAVLARTRFGADARHLPLAIQRNFPGPITAAARQAARITLGLPENQKIICSFGFISRNKAIPTALHALAQLRETIPARLIFVGEPTSDTNSFQNLAAELGLTPHITFGQNFIPESVYRNHLLAADCALQLREGPPGNISGALHDCIAAGLPAVASRDLADNLSAPIYVKRVSNTPDAAEIAAALAAALTENSATEWERAAYCDANSMASYAKKLLNLLEV